MVLNLAYNKNKLREKKKKEKSRLRDMLNFEFLEKGLGIVSPPNFAYNFSRNMFLLTEQM